MKEINGRLDGTFSRLGGSPGRPPMPCVEDEHVSAEPDSATLDGVELKNSSNLLSDNVHQIMGEVVHHRHVVVLQRSNVSWFL